MQILQSIGILFIGLAVFFLGITLRNYLKVEGNMTIAQRVWLRIALIFAGVGIGLCLIQILL